MFTTIAAVRELTGLVDNDNVTDSYIQEQINRAQGVMLSKLSARYILPIPTYYTNTLAFTGAGTGTGVMTFTINASTYVINITNDMTASQAADAFRLAASVSANTDFVTDPILSGATVNLWSAKPNWPQGCAISVAVTPVEGIVVTVGTETIIQIPTLEHICAELTADYIQLAGYGPEMQNTDSGWKDKKKDTMLELEELHLDEMYLFDFAGNILPQAAMAVPVFFPTQASQNEWPDPTYNRGRMNKQF